jgi:hypothetical protein
MNKYAHILNLKAKFVCSLQRVLQLVLVLVCEHILGNYFSGLSVESLLRFSNVWNASNAENSEWLGRKLFHLFLRK